MDFLRLPFFNALEPAQNVLIAGMGGGFDIFCGLPLYFGLQSVGKNVHLANYSFAELTGAKKKRLSPAVMEVSADIGGRKSYFPELHLTRWFREQNKKVPIYAFESVGVVPLLKAYQAVVAHLNIDVVILVDGGTDSLMRGDEAGLGTAEEDVTSLAAVHQLNVPIKLMACLGFGIDTFHGVCHADVLEAVADITRAGGFLGAWSLTGEMPEVQLYREAAEYVFAAMPQQPSIVSSSILSAIEGHFGDYHAIYRTQGSKLFINALMSFYWGFQLDTVAQRLLYLDKLKQTQTYYDVSEVITMFRAACPPKDWTSLPM